MELKFRTPDKSIQKGCWVLDYKFLNSIIDKLEGTDYYADLETVEAILLIANGDYELWKQSVDLELED